MSFDIDAYKLARIREAESDARNDIAKSLAHLHERLTLIEASLHEKLNAVLEMAKAPLKKKD